jgi:hypothetical protein
MTSLEEGKVWAQALNKTSFRVLVWSFNEESTLKAGVKNVYMLKKLKLKTTGQPSQSFIMYLYVKTNGTAPIKRNRQKSKIKQEVPRQSSSVSTRSMSKQIPQTEL